MRAECWSLCNIHIRGLTHEHFSRNPRLKSHSCANGLEGFCKFKWHKGALGKRERKCGCQRWIRGWAGLWICLQEKEMRAMLFMLRNEHMLMPFRLSFVRFSFCEAVSYCTFDLKSISSKY